MIIFKKLRWKNLLSTGNTFTEIDLNATKTTLILGCNGGGKSSLLDALIFALYGKPFRKVNKGQLVNSINGKGTVVEIEFDIGNYSYKVVRGIKPNVFEIYQDNELLNQPGDSKDYQEILEKQIIKKNMKSFTQIEILGSASFTPFMQLTAAHRREVIEDLLDLQVFSVMNLGLKQKVQENKDALGKVETSIQLTNQSIKAFHQHLEALKNNNDTLIEQYQETIEEHNSKIAELEIQHKDVIAVLPDLKEKIVDLPKHEAKLKKLNDFKIQIDERKRGIEKEMAFYEKNDSCPTCKQDLQVDHKHSVITDKNTQLKTIEEGLARYQEEVSIVRDNIAGFKVFQKEIDEVSQKALKIKGEISQLDASNKTLQRSIDNIHAQSKKNSVNMDELKNLEADLEDFVNKKNSLANDKVVLESAALLLKDSGIKTKMIKQYITIMNSLINKYLAAMEFFVEFELNENFEETIKSRYRDEFSYQSFSEGEKSRLDLALLFTWRAIGKMRNSTTTNLLLLDEVFDSSLDYNGTDYLLNIIESLSPETNIFVISHKTDALMERFDRVLKFEKVKNFSRMEIIE